MNIVFKEGFVEAAHDITAIQARVVRGVEAHNKQLSNEYDLSKPEGRLGHFHQKLAFRAQVIIPAVEEVQARIKEAHQRFCECPTCPHHV